MNQINQLIYVGHGHNNNLLFFAENKKKMYQIFLFWCPLQTNSNDHQKKNIKSFITNTEHVCMYSKPDENEAPKNSTQNIQPEKKEGRRLVEKSQKTLTDFFHLYGYWLRNI